MKLKSLLATTLSLAMLFGSTMLVSAATSETASISSDGTQSTNVVANITSHFTVTIPKQITLDGRSKSVNYTVSIDGELANNETVSVVPDSTFLMSSVNKANQTATVTQDKQEWTCEETGINGTGTVCAENITAGHWNGTFNFSIGLHQTDIETCEHEWVEVTETIHHDEVGHYETVTVKEAWDEKVWESVTICNGCGMTFTGPNQVDDAIEHCTFECKNGYHTEEKQVTIHHDAVTEQRWVVDQNAYDETVTTGYKCSICGATK